MNRTIYRMSLLPVIFMSLILSASCGSPSIDESGENTDSEVSSQIARKVPDFPLIEKISVCGTNDKIEALRSDLSKVQEGLLSYKDLADPLEDLAQSLDFSSWTLGREELITDSPEILKWIDETEIQTLRDRLRNEYLWFAKKRVRLMDFGEFSKAELESRSDSLEQFLSEFCKED